MNRIKLSKGLIAFGGDRAAGKTRFLLKLANHLALTENVLFVSYTDYTERLEHILMGIDGKINPNLELNTTLGYYCVESFIELIEHIEYGKFSTVIIDNVEHYSLSPAGTFSYPGKDGIVDALLFISNRIKVRVVFSTRLVSNNLTDDFSTPTLQSFIWSREIINQCEQIFVIHRPTIYGVVMDAEDLLYKDHIELVSLKNEEHTEYSIKFTNEEYRFFDYPVY
jgi:hypothetical protein